MIFLQGRVIELVARASHLSDLRIVGQTLPFSRRDLRPRFAIESAAKK
jgi:hypothetical protein